MTVSGPGLVLDGDFGLVDHDRRGVSLAEYSGRMAVMFFGFTHCKVVCPRALTKLDRVIRQVDPAGTTVQGLYVTVDPERDTPAALQAYLRPTYPRFTGLTGDAETLAELRKAYKVFAQRRDEAGGGYNVPHSALVHVLDRASRHIDHWPETLDETAMEQRMRNALRAS